MKRIALALAVVASLFIIPAMTVATDEVHKTVICHVPAGEPENAHTIEVDDNALKAHLGDNPDGLHGGDYLGACEPIATGSAPVDTEPPVTEPPITEPPVTEPPSIRLFSAEAVPCPNAPDVAATSPSRLRIVGILLLLHVYIDGAPVVLDANNEVIVTPGNHHWTVLSADQQTTLAEGDVFCPECNATTQRTTPPNNDKTLPPTDTADVVGDNASTNGILPVLLVLGTISGASLILTRKRR